MFQLVKKMFLCVLTVSVTVSCTTGAAHNSVNTPRHVGSTKQLPLNNKAGLLVFRGKNDASVNQVTINVYVDGDYLTSLKKGEYQYVDLCPGRHYIEFAYANTDPAYLRKLNKNQVFELGSGDVLYTEMVGDGFGGVRIKPSSKDNVEKILPSLQLQQRTISRVVSGHNC